MGGRGGSPNPGPQAPAAAEPARTQVMKPRQIFDTQPRRIRVNGQWFELGTISLIGSRDWTIRDTEGNVLARVSGNTGLEVEA